jgi:transcriptional regulator with AAA-type ATPase domain
MASDSSTVTSNEPQVVPSSLLLVLSSAQAEPIRTASLPARGQVSIGRSVDCAVAVDDGSLSRRHATLRLPELTIIDHGSRNGTWIGARRIAEDVETPLAIGKPFRIGTVNAVVVRVGTLDRGVLYELDGQIARARRDGGAVVLVRGTPPVPPWAANVRVLSTADELWLGSVTCAQAAADALVRAAEGDVGLAVFPTDGYDAGELYLAAEHDRARRRAGASAIDRVYALAARVAPSDVDVLIQGETGVGKEVMASFLHRRSPRADRPLVQVNCAAIAPSLFESQMFGHERGAFTGATESKSGLIEAADGGTLFLDEVAELPLELQAKLLRVLEDRIVVRVGATEGRRVDVRFVTATNEPLPELVERGEFRGDLYYRLATVTIQLPPLRERRGEIRGLAELFVLRAAELTRAEPPALSAAALARLESHAWPGNVRELRNVIQRAVLLCEGPTIEPRHLLLDEPQPAPAALPADLDADNAEHLTLALAHCAGNQTRAARLLGISRNTLLARLDKFGLPRPRKRDA